MQELSVATFNVHGGVNGWGRPFDVVDACRQLDADVLVLQETWTPREHASVAGGTGVAQQAKSARETGRDGGTAAPEPGGIAEQVGRTLGYSLTSVPMANARLHPAPPRVGEGWGPLFGRPRPVGMRVDAHRKPGAGRGSGRRGVVGIALLSRLPTSGVDVLELVPAVGGRVRRVALRTKVDSPEIVVAGTHLPHIRHGSPAHVRRLQRYLPSPDVPAVLVGDMNMWGPPLSLLMPGWSRAVRGRSWPAWRPMFQIDHVLVTEAVRVVGGDVLRIEGSDHLPVRAVLGLP
jgi:endonuclease/exonuclease/phosphatase family metal-dependent hydrolase